MRSHHSDKTLEENVLSTGLYVMYLLAAGFLVIFYSGMVALWFYLQSKRLTLGDYFYNEFLKDHCKEQPQLDAMDQIKYKKYSFDDPIDETSIPEEANIYRSKDPFPLHFPRDKDVPLGTPEMPSSS